MIWIWSLLRYSLLMSHNLVVRVNDLLQIEVRLEEGVKLLADHLIGLIFWAFVLEIKNIVDLLGN
jgi:hypothetical protein